MAKTKASQSGSEKGASKGSGAGASAKDSGANARKSSRRAGAKASPAGAKAPRGASANGGARKTSNRRAPAAAPLDTLLAEGSAGGPPRFVSLGTAARAAAALARRPRRVGRRALRLGGELAGIAAGRSERAPERSDRRFGDRAWQSNWLFRRIMQATLATDDAVERLIDDAELDWRDDRQVRFAAHNLLSALAPPNFPWSNPTVLKEVVEQGGANFVSGARRFVSDMSSSPRLPKSVDTSEFEVGKNLAVTPGAVVLRNEVLELIQYEPQTKRVREQPLLIVPPTINRYYILDIAPGKSLTEWLVQQGQQVFMISWRNPDADQGHFDLDTYVQAVADAREAVAEITGQERVHAMGACAGGIFVAGLMGHLAATDRLSSEIASATLMVCLLDNHRAGTVTAMASRDLAAAAIAESERKGYLDGAALAEVFAWLRPNDLVWSYWVNNYLLGKDPPAFDVLYWNQDSVRLAAGLHRDFVNIALDNSFTQPGALDVLGTPIDLGAVELDSYVLAGIDDHIVSWENAYRTTQLLGGKSRFVLSTSGHIQSFVNPPSPESRSSYRTATKNPKSADQWMKGASKESGSWWSDYDDWLGERSGKTVPAPKKLGSANHKRIAKAPGSYVHAT